MLVRVRATQVGEEPPLGKRERKKRETRAAILDAAERLFAADGYDGVTVAAIADAAGTSVKTLFTYFDSKQDLVLAREERRLAGVPAAVDERDPGSTPLEAVTAALVAALADEDDPEGLEAFHRRLETGAAVASRLLRMFAGCEGELAEVLAAERNEARPSPETLLVAAQLTALVRIATSPEALAFVRARRSAAGEEPALRDWIERASTQLGAGLGDYGRRPGTPS
jgi:AcrR family transcriptional regulator